MHTAPATSTASQGSAGEQMPLVTKLTIPPLRPDLVARPRLTTQLYRSIQCPLTLIAAPAGFGKTTLVSAWLADCSCTATWLSLDAGDDDLTRFWFYVFTALERIAPGTGVSVLALLHGSALQPRPSIETVLTVWINCLAALPDDVVLILDDYHQITTPSIHHALTYLLDHLPQRLHLVIATRADPPLPLARLRARGNLTEIRAADLRFTVDEMRAFLAGTLGQELAEAEVAALAARTEGWIVGVRLAALSMQRCNDLSAFLTAFTGSQRYIIDYLTEEVLARQGEHVQTFLLQTAILERLEASLCAAVTDGSDDATGSQALLERLEQANLFLVPLDDERRWYRYHQLFAEALRHHLQRTQPLLLPELHRRASIWYEQHGLPYDAIHHALAAADVAQAACLIEQACPALVSRGEIATLQRWIAALPTDLIRTNRELAVTHGWLLFVSGQHAAAERHLREIERIWGIDGGLADHAAPPTLPSGAERSAELRGRIAAIRASIAITQGDLPRTIALSRRALADLPKAHMARTYAAWFVGRAAWLQGDVPAACSALAEAAQICWDVQHLYTAFRVVHDLAQVQQCHGQLHQAEETYRQALQRVGPQNDTIPALGPAAVGRGMLAYAWNQLEPATALLHAGIAQCEQSGNEPAILQAYTTLAFVKQAEGDTAGARAMMEHAARRIELQRLPQSSAAPVDAARAWLSLMQGDRVAAAGWRQRRGLSLAQEITHLHEREYLTLARILIAERHLDAAQQWLAKLLQLAEAQGRTGSVLEILMLQAAAFQGSGDADQAIERLARALDLAEPEGYIRLFVDEGRPMAALLTRMQDEDGRMQGYIRTLLAAFEKQDDYHPSSFRPQPLVEPLSERELAVLRLIVAGCSNQEIADRLVLALSTVKWYINAIYGKLQVTSRTKAIARARELDIR